MVETNKAACASGPCVLEEDIIEMNKETHKIVYEIEQKILDMGCGIGFVAVEPIGDQILSVKTLVKIHFIITDKEEKENLK